MEAHARSSDPGTSHEAAKTMSSEKIEELHDKICDCLKDLTIGGTLDEMMLGTGITVQTLSPRMVELERKGRAYRIQIGLSEKGRPKYLQRKGMSGRQQQVWFAQKVH